MNIQAVVADNINPPEAVTPPDFCTSITVMESGGLATTDYLIRAPLPTSPAVRVAAGQQLRLQSDSPRPFSPNEPAFYLETAAGTVTFTVIYA